MYLGLVHNRRMEADAPCSVGATLLIIGGTTRRQTNHGWSRTLAAMASMWSDIEQLILLQWNLDGESTLQHDSWCDATVYNRGPVLCFRMSSTNNGFRSSVLWIRLLCLSFTCSTTNDSKENKKGSDGVTVSLRNNKPPYPP